jgi:hypothetical protein
VTVLDVACTRGRALAWRVHVTMLDVACTRGRALAWRVHANGRV